MATRGLHPIWPQADTPVDELGEAERLLLDAARAWGEPGALGGPMARARFVLASAGAQGLAPAFDAALRPLSGMRIACPLCPRVSAEEGAWLAAVGVAQGTNRGVALALLQTLAPPLPAYQAMPALVGLACGFARLGLRLGAR